ncbi:hypothetical protein T265_03827 [Opisthorchis viverrini]|uniref:Secreted protein n=1 Tax=Opisthorchis viverrini TaxID=6198 RepID=A0A075AHC2_OPIVI|nr:hypothetical protein T265_03827 [Opisthorchis viverrini]KER29629.1 hypothetical protein T265_03827 [Opisthorchis viverrini]
MVFMFIAFNWLSYYADSASNLPPKTDVVPYGLILLHKHSVAHQSRLPCHDRFFVPNLSLASGGKRLLKSTSFTVSRIRFREFRCDRVTMLCTPPSHELTNNLMGVPYAAPYPTATNQRNEPN